MRAFKALPIPIAEQLAGPGKAAHVFAAHVSRECLENNAGLPIGLRITPGLYARLRRSADRSGTTVTTLTRAALRATIEAIEKGAREVQPVAKPSVTCRRNCNARAGKYWVGPMTFKVKGHWRSLPNRTNGTHRKTA